MADSPKTITSPEFSSSRLDPALGEQLTEGSRSQLPHLRLPNPIFPQRRSCSTLPMNLISQRTANASGRPGKSIAPCADGCSRTSARASFAESFIRSSPICSTSGSATWTASTAGLTRRRQILSTYLILVDGETFPRQLRARPIFPTSGLPHSSSRAEYRPVRLLWSQRTC
jgi:hypothetical protein